MEERNCFVYEDIRMDNLSCYYVGMGSKNEEKGYDRFEVAERNDHHDRIMNKYGIVRTIIRDNLTREEANALEEARIYYYVFVLGYTIDIKGYRKGERKDSHLTNQTWGGDGTKGYNPFANKTEEEMKEIAKKMSEKRQGEKHPMYGRTGEKAYWYGKHLSGEHKKKIGETRVEKGLSKGEKNPMYGRTGEKHPMYGKPALNRKKVKCHTGEIFNTLTQAGEWSGSHRSSIAKQIQGKQKSAGKHPVTGEKLHWEYVVEETIETNLNLLTISNINISI